MRARIHRHVSGRGACHCPCVNKVVFTGGTACDLEEQMEFSHRVEACDKIPGDVSLPTGQFHPFPPLQHVLYHVSAGKSPHAPLELYLPVSTTSPMNTLVMPDITIAISWFTGAFTTDCIVFCRDGVSIAHPLLPFTCASAATPRSCLHTRFTF